VYIYIYIYNIYITTPVVEINVLYCGVYISDIALWYIQLTRCNFCQTTSARSVNLVWRKMAEWSGLYLYTASRDLLTHELPPQGLQLYNSSGIVNPLKLAWEPAFNHMSIWLPGCTHSSNSLHLHVLADYLINRL